MKYHNWVEFKVNAMELFLHNPELVRVLSVRLIFSFATMYNMRSTRRE